MGIFLYVMMRQTRGSGGMSGFSKAKPRTPQDGRIVTFADDAIPSKDVRISAGFCFDVPVRFDIDNLTLNLSAFQAGDIPSIPLIEIK